MSTAERRAVVWLVLVTLAAPAVAKPATRESLVRELDAALTAPALRGGVQAVIVECLDTGDVWYERNPNLLLLPASNQKLITTAAALALLGADYRFATTLKSRKTALRDGVIRGDLYLCGSGDPFLDEDGLDDLVRQLTQRGVKEVEGSIVGDGSCYPPPAYGYGWSWDDMSYYYSAPVCGLNYHRNVCDITVIPAERPGHRAGVRLLPSCAPVSIVNQTMTRQTEEGGDLSAERDLGGSTVRVAGAIPPRSAGGRETAVRVTVSNPALYAVRRLREKLRSAGILVRGSAKQGTAASDATEVIGTTFSPPLSELVRLVNKPSDNLGAECLLRAIGLARKGVGSVAAGREEVIAWLKSIGAPADGIILRDGSGLSRMNYVTAYTLRCVLRAMTTSPLADIYRESLPVAGVDGTLRSRMKDTPAQGNCRAKTGYASNVSSLSGYVATKSGKRLLFVILMNNHACRNADATAVQDRMAVALAGYDGE